MGPGAPSSSYQAPTPTQYAPQTPGIAPWLHQGTQPLQAGGRVGEFLRTGVMPQQTPAQNMEPWYGNLMNAGMNNAAQNVQAQQQQSAALEAQKVQAEVIRNLQEEQAAAQERMQGRADRAD